MDRFWRLVIASALNADLETIALSYAAKVIRELFLNSAQAGSMGMSTVPLSELYRVRSSFLLERGGEVVFNASVESAEWDEETCAVGARDTGGRADVRVFWCWRCRLRARPSCCRTCRRRRAPMRSRSKSSGMSTGPSAACICGLTARLPTLEHAVLLDREIHWMYNKSRLQPGRNAKGSYLDWW